MGIGQDVATSVAFFFQRRLDRRLRAKQVLLDALNDLHCGFVWLLLPVVGFFCVTSVDREFKVVEM